MSRKKTQKDNQRIQRKDNTIEIVKKLMTIFRLMNYSSKLSKLEELRRKFTVLQILKGESKKIPEMNKN